MEITSKALETARRNLTQRIERYLDVLAKREAKVGWREGDHLERALAHLEAGTLDAGERDMMWAEWASRQPDAADPHPTATVETLRQRFAAIVTAA